MRVDVGLKLAAENEDLDRHGRRRGPVEPGGDADRVRLAERAEEAVGDGQHQTSSGGQGTIGLISGSAG